MNDQVDRQIDHNYHVDEKVCYLSDFLYPGLQTNFKALVVQGTSSFKFLLVHGDLNLSPNISKIKQ